MAKYCLALKSLGLDNSDYQDKIAKTFSYTAIIGQLKTLNLSMGTMSDVGANALVAAADKLKDLESINVSDNYLSNAGSEAERSTFGE